MDPLLATLAVLVLALAVVGYGFSRRLDRMRGELVRLDKLEALEQRVAALATQLEQSERGSALQARLSEFAEANLKLASGLAELRQRLPVGGKPARAPATHPADAVREHLARIGFDDVHVLTDLETLPAQTGRVVFEARRRGVVHKGYVELSAGKVLAESAQSAYAAFP